MAGLNDTDIRLNDEWQLTQASTGDAPVCSGLDCFLQDIRLEAITQPGELFYNSEWGWGLLEFLQAEDDDLTRLEISERVKDKLRRRKEIRAETITVTILFEDTHAVPPYRQQRNTKYRCWARSCESGGDTY